MARDGSGVYTNPYPNFVAGTVISSTEVDANNTQMAAALTQSIAVDGQTTVTANLPMNSNKFTGLAVGSAATDSLTLGQAQASAYIWCGTMGGAADAGTLSPTPAITAYAAGQRFAWKASTNTNTGAMTVAISGLSTIAAQKDRTALAAGDHVASDIYVGILDTTSTMQIMKFAGTDINLAAPGPIGGTTAAAASFTTVSATGNITLGDAANINMSVPLLAGADHTFTGLSAQMLAGGTIAAFDLVCIHTTTQEVVEADASAYATARVIGIAPAAISDTATGTVLLQGFIRDDSWSWTAGSTLYLSETAGAMTHTAPSTDGAFVLVVGVALSPDVVYINPSMDVIERA
tara:strand:- start:204 stop:1247 length:1044 start_codon:yes stop_codon:yes gene_type:complete